MTRPHLVDDCRTPDTTTGDDAAAPRTATPAVIVAAEVGAVAWLHHLGGAAWARLPASTTELASADLVDLAVAVARLVGIGLGWWCLVTTVLAVVVHRRSTDRLSRRRALALVPGFLRRRLEQGLTAVVVTGAMLAPAAASATPLPPGLDPGAVLPAAGAEATPEPDPEVAPSETVPDDTATVPLPVPMLPPGLQTVPTAPTTHDGWRVTSPPPAPAPPMATPDPAPPEVAPPAVAPPTAAPPVTPTETTAPAPSNSGDDHVVVAGEHLWSIARDHLTTTDQPHDDDAVATYWRAVVAANAGSLPSGDPDLVHPGQTVLLPPVVTA